MATLPGRAIPASPSCPSKADEILLKAIEVTKGRVLDKRATPFSSFANEIFFFPPNRK